MATEFRSIFGYFDDERRRGCGVAFFPIDRSDDFVERESDEIQRSEFDLEAATAGIAYRRYAEEADEFGYFGRFRGIF